MRRSRVAGILVIAASVAFACCAAVILVPNEGLYPRPTELAPPETLPSGPWWEEALKLLDGPIQTLWEGAKGDATRAWGTGGHYTMCAEKAARIKRYKETIEKLVERAITGPLQRMNLYLDEILEACEGPPAYSEESDQHLKELLGRVNELQQELKTNLTPPAGRP